MTKSCKQFAVPCCLRLLFVAIHPRVQAHVQSFLKRFVSFQFCVHLVRKETEESFFVFLQGSTVRSR